MLVKLLAGLMLVFVLIGETVPAAFAEEEATTEAETAAPEQGSCDLAYRGERQGTCRAA